LGENYVPGANNYGAHRPYRADDAGPNNARRTRGAPQTTDEVSEHDDTLAQLQRDLDRLLQLKSRDDENQHRSIDERDQFVEDLHRSPISSANDYEVYPPPPANDEWPNGVRGTGGASQITNEVGEHEERLAQLKRDLDLLLQLPKRA
jgi:hypothetical protein